MSLDIVSQPAKRSLKTPSHYVASGLSKEHAAELSQLDAEYDLAMRKIDQMSLDDRVEKRRESMQKHNERVRALHEKYTMPQRRALMAEFIADARESLGYCDQFGEEFARKVEPEEPYFQSVYDAQQAVTKVREWCHTFRKLLATIPVTKRSTCWPQTEPPQELRVVSRADIDDVMFYD